MCEAFVGALKKQFPAYIYIVLVYSDSDQLPFAVFILYSTRQHFVYN